MAFSASDAAFEGFRIIRREPLSVVVWAGLRLVLGAAGALVTVPAMGALSASAAGGSAASPATVFANFAKVLPLEAAMVPVYLILTAMLSAAVFRAVLRPADKGIGRVKFGADELRLIGLSLLIGVIILGAVLGLALIVGIGVASLSLGGSKTPGAGLVLGILAIYLAVIVVAIWVGVKLSLAAPMTFAQRRIRLFESWSLTKGRFWPLFGCYLLAWVFAVLIGLVDLAVVGAVSLGTSGGSLTQAATSMMRPDYSSYVAYFTPVRIVILIVGSAFGAITGAIAIAAPAEAYRQIAGLSPTDQAEAFS